MRIPRKPSHGRRPRNDRNGIHWSIRLLVIVGLSAVVITGVLFPFLMVRVLGTHGSREDDAANVRGLVPIALSFMRGTGAEGDSPPHPNLTDTSKSLHMGGRSALVDHPMGYALEGAIHAALSLVGGSSCSRGQPCNVDASAILSHIGSISRQGGGLNSSVAEILVPPHLNDSAENVISRLYDFMAQKLEANLTTRRVSLSGALSVKAQLTACQGNKAAMCSQGKVVLYNPSMLHPRTFCEVVVPPGGTAVLDRVEKTCPERQYEIKLDGGRGERFKNCDVGCSQPHANGIIRLISVYKTPWKFTYSMEGPQYYNQLRRRHVLNSPGANGFAPGQTNFWATTDMKSTVPLPYFSWDEYSIQQPMVDHGKAEHAASFIAKNCGSKNNREGIVKELQRHTRIDSLSTCMHNADPVNGVGWSNKNLMLQQYLFHLAFENQCEDDYVTEKLWGTLQSGTLPVYYGAPNIRQHAPDNSIIVVDDYRSDLRALANHLQYLERNRTAYEEYHAWRYKPLPQWFVERFNFTHDHSICRICRYSYARLNGLGWNHEKQQILRKAGMEEPLTFNDGLRTASRKGFIEAPFVEKWAVANDVSNAPPASTPLNVMTLNGTIPFHDVTKNLLAYGTKWWRTAIESEGFVEILFESPLRSLDHQVVLQLRSPIRDNIVYFADENGFRSPVVEHTTLNDFSALPMASLAFVQNDTHRFTVLTESGARMGSFGNGSIHVVLGKSWGQGRDTRLLNKMPSLDMHQAVSMRKTIRVLVESVAHLKQVPRLTERITVTSFCDRVWDELRHPVVAFSAK